MIRFEPVKEPPDFAKRVEAPGAAWLVQHTKDRPKDLWSPFKGHLAEAFHNLCAYSVMFEPVGTVDHFVSCDEDRSKAYVWSNYRFASGWINSSKNSLLSTTIFDPFTVQDGWFEIILPSLQLAATDCVPVNLREKAQFVLKRLHLRDDERVLRQRREWYRMYQEGELTLEGLRKKAPLIAAAVVKQRGRSL
jgi:hypothetical protein